MGKNGKYTHYHGCDMRETGKMCTFQQNIIPGNLKATCVRTWAVLSAFRVDILELRSSNNVNIPCF